MLSPIRILLLLVVTGQTLHMCKANGTRGSRITMSNSSGMMLRIVSAEGDKSTWRAYYLDGWAYQTIAVSGRNNAWPVRLQTRASLLNIVPHNHTTAAMGHTIISTTPASQGISLTDNDVFLAIQRFCPNVTQNSIFSDGWVTVGYILAFNPALSAPQAKVGIDCQGDMDQGCSADHFYTLGVGSWDDRTLTSKHGQMHYKIQRNDDTVDNKEYEMTVFSVPPVCNPDSECGKTWKAQVC